MSKEENVIQNKVRKILSEIRLDTARKSPKTYSVLPSHREHLKILNEKLNINDSEIIEIGTKLLLDELEVVPSEQPKEETKTSEESAQQQKKDEISETEKTLKDNWLGWPYLHQRFPKLIELLQQDKSEDWSSVIRFLKQRYDRTIKSKKAISPYPTEKRLSWDEAKPFVFGALKQLQNRLNGKRISLNSPDILGLMELGLAAPPIIEVVSKERLQELIRKESEGNSENKQI